MTQPNSTASVEEFKDTAPCQQDVILRRYLACRKFSEVLAAPLSPEDTTIQSMPDASPTKWHLAHTSWFFETFLLKRDQNYQPVNDQFEFLFNSYYNTVGRQFPRARRGLLSRPTLAETLEYRAAIDDRVVEFVRSLPEEQFVQVKGILETGIQHEQQHQELLLTDIKHALSLNPLNVKYSDHRLAAVDEPDLPTTWYKGTAGITHIGIVSDASQFAFDNEHPRHRVYLHDYGLAETLVTCGDFLEFIKEDGYSRPELWLSAGWDAVQKHQWQAPLYWEPEDSGWSEFTLSGRVPLNLQQPVCHVSYFEADAFARWKGCRLPTEFEWEDACQDLLRGESRISSQEVFADHLMSLDLQIHPQVETHPALLGNVWQWTSSQYVAYPGYHPPAGAIGEYNGKFMCNQFVLRGGSCATHSSHIRSSYRNFFAPDARWQFSGFRLARG